MPPRALHASLIGWAPTGIPQPALSLGAGAIGEQPADAAHTCRPCACASLAVPGGSGKVEHVGDGGVVAHLSAGALWLRTLQLPLCKCRRLVRCMGPVQQPSWQSCTGPLACSLCNCLFANLAGWFVVSGLPATVCLREQISLRVCRELGNRLQPPWLLSPATIPLAGHHSCLHGGVHSLRGLQ